MIFITTAGVVLLGGAGLILALRKNEHRAIAAVATQLAACVLVLFSAAPVLSGGEVLEASAAWSYPVESVRLRLDPLGAFFLAWSLPLTLLGTIYAVGYLRPYYATRNAGVQFALLNITALSFVMVYTLQNAIAFLLGWEIAAVAAWLLVIWDYRNQKIRFAGFNYLVSTHVGFFFLVAAMMILYSQTQSMDLDSFSEVLMTPGNTRNVTFVLLVTSFGLKSAFFPFHTWLPRAHSAAPAHVSALMSGVIHKAGLFGLLRFTLLLGQPEPWMAWFLICFSALSILMGVLYTTAQRDLKRLLGYSSTENVGIVGLGFGVGYLGLCWHNPALMALGFTAGLLHILNHALFKCLLFYAAGSIYRSTHSVDIERLGGLARVMPWTASFYLLGGLAISALPPLNGFVSELTLYAGLLQSGGASGLERALLICAAALLAFAGGVSALAMTRSFGLTFLGSPRDPHLHAQGDAAPTMKLTMALHALGVVALGVMPSLGLSLVAAPVDLFSDFAGTARGAVQAHVLGLLEPATRLSLLVVGIVGGLLLLRFAFTPKAPRHVTWGCGYTAPTARMQYTATSFSSQFANLFDSILSFLRKEKLPEGPFPAGTSQINTHCVDAVERRMFEVLGDGEGVATRVATWMSEESRIAFALGLLVLSLFAAAIVLTGGLP
jgi:hydrogenase-4 component B